MIDGFCAFDATLRRFSASGDDRVFIEKFVGEKLFPLASELWQKLLELPSGLNWSIDRVRQACEAFGMMLELDSTGARMDSPGLNLKPVSKEGIRRLVFKLSGRGGLWHTWFDHDLTVAGRMIIREKKDDLEAYLQRIVRIEEPIMRIHTLAIHLDSRG